MPLLPAFISPATLLRTRLRTPGRTRGSGVVAGDDDGSRGLVNRRDGRPARRHHRRRAVVAAAAGAVASSTGTVVAAATLGLRYLEGIRRAAIAVLIEGEKHPFLVLDVGANPMPKAHHFAQYALMGSAYYECQFQKSEPRVGLLNIGSEEMKGNTLVRDARGMMKNMPMPDVDSLHASVRVMLRLVRPRKYPVCCGRVLFESLCALPI